MDKINELKLKRELKNMSAEELAYKAGVSFNTIKRIESGKGGMNFKTALKLAQVLGVDVGELVCNSTTSS